MKSRIFDGVEVLLKLQAFPNEKELPTFRKILSLCSGSIFFLLHGPNHESAVNFHNTKICLPVEIE